MAQRKFTAPLEWRKCGMFLLVASALNCSLRYWEYFPNYFLAPLSITIRCKKSADRAVIGYWQRNCQLCLYVPNTSYEVVVQDGGRTKLAANLRASPFKEFLKIETIFAQIHLGKQ